VCACVHVNVLRCTRARFFAMSNRLANMSNLQPNREFYDMGRSFPPKPANVVPKTVATPAIAPLPNVPASVSDPVRLAPCADDALLVTVEDCTRVVSDILFRPGLLALDYLLVTAGRVSAMWRAPDVCTITLNRPSARNALNLGLLQRLLLMVRQLSALPLPGASPSSPSPPWAVVPSDGAWLGSADGQKFAATSGLAQIGKHRPHVLVLRANGPVFSSGHDLKVTSNQ
jgi:hypothetical protein